MKVKIRFCAITSLCHALRLVPYLVTILSFWIHVRYTPVFPPPLHYNFTFNLVIPKWTNCDQPSPWRVLPIWGGLGTPPLAVSSFDPDHHHHVLMLQCSKGPICPIAKPYLLTGPVSHCGPQGIYMFLPPWSSLPIELFSEIACLNPTRYIYISLSWPGLQTWETLGEYSYLRAWTYCSGSNDDLAQSTSVTVTPLSLASEKVSDFVRGWLRTSMPQSGEDGDWRWAYVRASWRHPLSRLSKEIMKSTKKTRAGSILRDWSSGALTEL